MAEVALLAIGKGALTKLAGLAADRAVQEVCLVWGAEKELNKLENSLTTIMATLSAADEGQYAITSPDREWLEKLKDVAYDADDMVDDYATEVLWRKVEGDETGCCNAKEVCGFFPRLLYSLTIGHRIKEIRERLKNITLDKNNFHPIAQLSFPRQISTVERDTHSFLPNPSRVIGREDDKEKILKFLKDDESHISIIPIVGMGGLGKTTLAQLVFNDDWVVDHFKQRVWVWVSEDTNTKSVIQKIIKSKSKDLTMEDLMILFKEKMGGKQYLLVLDDVWKLNHNAWVKLRGMLMCLASGSKILITSRDKEVAFAVRTLPPYELPYLSFDHCWPLFEQCALREEDEGQKKKLYPIGREIVIKCRGVPLAVTTLGSLLSSTTNENEWMSIRDDEIWKLTEKYDEIEERRIDILPMLRLSYNHLSPHLKACCTGWV